MLSKPCMWHGPSPWPVSSLDIGYRTFSLKSKGKYASVSFKLLQDMGGVISLAIYTGTVPHVSFQKFAVAFYFVRCNGFCCKLRHARGQRHVLSHRVCWTPGIAKVDVAAGFQNNVFTTISSDKRSKITPGLFICIQQLKTYSRIFKTQTQIHTYYIHKPFKHLPFFFNETHPSFTENVFKHLTNWPFSFLHIRLLKKRKRSLTIEMYNVAVPQKCCKSWMFHCRFSLLNNGSSWTLLVKCFEWSCLPSKNKTPKLTQRLPSGTTTFWHFLT